MSDVMLRNVIKDDFPVFFKHQQDHDANHIAAFTSKDPGDWNKFLTHWNKILADKDIIKQTITVNNDVVGNILCFEQFGVTGVSYWIGKEYLLRACPPLLYHCERLGVRHCYGTVI